MIRDCWLLAMTQGDWMLVAFAAFGAIVLIEWWVWDDPYPL